MSNISKNLVAGHTLVSYDSAAAGKVLGKFLGTFSDQYGIFHLIKVTKKIAGYKLGSVFAVQSDSQFFARR